jgi:crossover junction endodeoxyribonuclease RuvC
VEREGSRLSFVDCGVIRPDTKIRFEQRLLTLHIALQEVILRLRPDVAAIEETFVNVNANATLKLGNARGAILLSLAQAGLPVSEYAPNLVKKTVVGAGRAEKTQVDMMVQMLLPGCGSHGLDAMDALAIAITHAQHDHITPYVAAQMGA